jgi:hypothetical protein
MRSNLEPVVLSRWLTDRANLWPEGLLSTRELASFADRRGLNFNREGVVRLWSAGLLRADLVRSKRLLRRSGLVLLKTESRHDHPHIYADSRRLRRRSGGWIDIAARKWFSESTVEPLFHPFRFYVLERLAWVLPIHISLTQPLIARAKYPHLVNWWLENFENWSASPDAMTGVDHWNSIVTLAVATEPFTREVVSGTFRYPPSVGEPAQREMILQHWLDVEPYYQRLGQAELEEVRRAICISAELLDPHKDLHILLRLASSERRQRLRGRIGGAMHLLGMAETLRRATEEAFSEHLSEEDQLGFGWTAPDFKRRLYGTDRLLDGDRGASNEFLRQFRLDFGVQTRWYVEGQTEYAALDSVLGGDRPTGIELVNLRGHVAQKAGRGVAFRDSLRSDLKAGIFSMVSIDGDRSDFVQAVRKAAQDDEICGGFFVTTPDFEFGNFTLHELEEILWEIASPGRGGSRGATTAP